MTDTKKRSTCKIPVAPAEGCELLTVPETAWVLRSCVDLVYRLIARGDLPSTSVGAKRFVTRKAVAAYLAAQTTTRRPEAVQAAVVGSVKLRESGLWNGKNY